jgi:hypothetical protein
MAMNTAFRKEMMAAGALVALLTLGACAEDRYSTGYYGDGYRADIEGDGYLDRGDRRQVRVYRDSDGDGVPNRYDRFPRNPNRR